MTERADVERSPREARGDMMAWCLVNCIYEMRFGGSERRSGLLAQLPGSEDGKMHKVKRILEGRLQATTFRDGCCRNLKKILEYWDNFEVNLEDKNGSSVTRYPVNSDQKRAHWKTLIK